MSFGRTDHRGDRGWQQVTAQRASNLAKAKKVAPKSETPQGVGDVSAAESGVGIDERRGFLAGFG